MVTESRTKNRSGVTRLLRPGWVVLLVAPFFGETLSAARPPLDLLLPWNLALLAGLYGYRSVDLP